MEQQYSKHQQKIIQRYYDNRENIGLQRLSELVTELYLAEGKKREKQWEMVEKALAKCGVKQERIDLIRKKNDPQMVAKVVEELMAKG